MVDHEGQDTLRPGCIVLLHSVFRRAAGVTVGHARPVLKRSVGMGIARCVQLFFKEMDRIVEEKGVSVAHGEVKFAFELRAEANRA